MIGKADAIVVLGCVTPSHALARRISLGARLFHSNAASRIIASGGRRWGEHVEALDIESGLREAGVPASAIVRELCSLSTLENACYSAELLRTLLGGRSAFIATSPWHLPRALADFQRCGVEALAPPNEWLEAPASSRAVRLREGVCAWADSVMMPRVR